MEAAHVYRRGRSDLDTLDRQHLQYVWEELPKGPLRIGFRAHKEKWTRDMNSTVIRKSLKPPRKERTVQRRGVLTGSIQRAWGAEK